MEGTVFDYAQNYGLVGFLIAIVFIQPIIFLKVIYSLFIRMAESTEKSATAMKELTTYMRGRNGRSGQ